MKFLQNLYQLIKKFKESIKYNDIPEWDPIGHMTLMSDLEEGFKISIDTDDVIDFAPLKRNSDFKKIQDHIIKNFLNPNENSNWVSKSRN